MCEHLVFLYFAKLIDIQGGFNLESLGQVYVVPMRMTVKGWDFLRYKHAGVNSNQFFIATQFDWPGDGEKQLKDSVIAAIIVIFPRKSGHEI